MFLPTSSQILLPFWSWNWIIFPEFTASCLRYKTLDELLLTNLPSPFTSNLVLGDVSPIPTFPPSCIIILTLLLRVWNSKCSAGALQISPIVNNWLGDAVPIPTLPLFSIHILPVTPPTVRSDVSGFVPKTKAPL